MNTYKITLEVSDPYVFFNDKEKLESAVRDLLIASILPALNLELEEITTTRKKG
jgi:hypothetical protein